MERSVFITEKWTRLSFLLKPISASNKKGMHAVSLHNEIVSQNTDLVYQHDDLVSQIYVTFVKMVT